MKIKKDTKTLLLEAHIRQLQMDLSRRKYENEQLSQRNVKQYSIIEELRVQVQSHLQLLERIYKK